MPNRTKLVIAAAAVGALLLGVGAWAVVGPDGERSPEDTVTAFFEARHSGDCGQMLDLIAEASWSDDGDRSRDEFLQQCADVIEGYQPELDDVQVRSESDDQALVQVAMPVDADMQPSTRLPRPRTEGIVVSEYGDTTLTESETLAYEDGQLIREDGEWKVELDQHAFGLGRSVEETVWGYLDAYRGGDCDRMIDYLTEDAWSTQGTVTRDDFLRACAASAAARPTPPSTRSDGLHPFATVPEIGMPLIIETSYEPEAALADIRWSYGASQETAKLIVEDLEWKLDSADLDAVGFAELGAKLVEKTLGLGQSTWGAATLVESDRGPDYTNPLEVYEGDDALEYWRKAGLERGLAARFGGVSRRVELLLYEFADAAGAEQYAEHLQWRIVARATEYDDVAPIRVAGVDGGTTIVTECSGAGFRPRSAGGNCAWANKAAAVATRGRFLVAVEAVDFKGPDPTAAQMVGQATKVLKAQLRRL